MAFSALVASAGGASRALAAGPRRLNTRVSAADAHSTANVGRDTEASTALIPEIAALAHDHGATVEVIVATAWTVRSTVRPDPQRVERVGRRPKRGADRIAIADTIGTATPGASSRSSNGSAPYRRPAAGRALPTTPGAGAQ